MADSKSYSRVLDRSEDVITSTQLYGIFNPKNLHSFQGTLSLFLPVSCAVCEQMIYPVVDAATCVRCGLYSHRKCVSKQRDCKMFTFKPSHREPQLASTTSIRRLPLPAASQVDDGFVSAFVTKLDNFVEKACMIPTVLNCMPEPGSQYCIWKSILRAVALNQSSLTDQSLPLDANLMSNAEHQELLFKTLSDTHSFPGQVAYVCTYAFTSLQFDSVDTLLQHARECLDTVVCAILSVSSDSLSCDPQAMDCLVTLVDRFMLQQHEDVIYVKLMTEIQRSTRVKLLASNPERISTRCFPKNWRAKCVVYSTQLGKARAPMDKLQALVRLLQYLAKLANRTERKQEETDEEEGEGRGRGGRGRGGDAHVMCAQDSLSDRQREERVEEGEEEEGREREESEERGRRSPRDEEEVCGGKVSPKRERQTEKRGKRSPVQTEKEGEGGSSSRSGSAGSCESEESLLEPMDQHGWITYNRNVAALWETVVTDDNSPGGLARSRSGGGEGEADAGEEDAVLVERPKTAADTDQLLQLCAYVVYIQQREGVLDWIAECRFLSSEMTNGDAPAMNGPQGYALATLQQTLYYLVQGDCHLFH